MEYAVIKGFFDNGHDYYDVVGEIQIDDSKKELDAQEIYNIVKELERADRRQHGRSYRGKCIGFQVDDYEQDKQVDFGNAEFCDGEFVPAAGFEWTNWYVKDRKVIDEAFEIVEAEEA